MTGQEYHYACCLSSPCQKHSDSYNQIFFAQQSGQYKLKPKGSIRVGFRCLYPIRVMAYNFHLLSCLRLILLGIISGHENSQVIPWGGTIWLCNILFIRIYSNSMLRISTNSLEFFVSSIHSSTLLFLSPFL